MKFSNQNIPFIANGETVKIKTSIAFCEGDRIDCRDPFIMPYNGKYYFYRGAGDRGIECIVSDDLKNWSESITVFEVPENYHGVKCLFWAPECHYYDGKFHIFTSVASKLCNNHRVICSYVADNPLGPFEEKAILSPKDWDSIDGTLYIDEENQPWLVFVHEWTNMPIINGLNNGAMVAAKLNSSLTRLISDPIELFKARDPEWAKNGVTDGPFMVKTSDGSLYMLWSNFSENGYAVALAKSHNGKIDGKWEHDGFLYNDDGGHGMLFNTFCGKTLLALHTPNMRASKENPCHLALFEVKEENSIPKLVV